MVVFIMKYTQAWVKTNAYHDDHLNILFVKENQQMLHEENLLLSATLDFMYLQYTFL